MKNYITLFSFIFFLFFEIMFAEILLAQPTGACIIGSNCYITNSVDCAMNGGTYMGDGTECPPTEPCCDGNGGCIQVPIGTCQNGPCNQNCGVPTEPCCDGNGGCIQVPIGNCNLPCGPTCLPITNMGCINGVCFFLPGGNANCIECIPKQMGPECVNENCILVPNGKGCDPQCGQPPLGPACIGGQCIDVPGGTGCDQFCGMGPACVGGNCILVPGGTTCGDECTDPVDMSSFTAIYENRNVILSWTTATELNNSGFHILRIKDGDPDSKWKLIGYVEGHGTTNEPNTYTYKDREVNTGRYKYMLKQTDYNGTSEYHELSEYIIIGTPDKFSLQQNYPNPFNPETNIGFDLPQDAKVSLVVFDLNGKLVKTLIDNQQLSPGYYTTKFNAAELSSGTYFYRLISGETLSTKKMILKK